LSYSYVNESRGQVTPKRIVLEANRPTRTRQHNRTQSILEVPVVRRRPRRIHFGQSVPVPVVGVRHARLRSQLIRRVISVRRHAQRTQPVPHRVVAVALGRGRSLQHLRQFIQRVIGERRGYVRPFVRFRGTIPRRVVDVGRTVQSRARFGVQDAQQVRHRIVLVAGCHAVWPGSRPC